MKTQPLFIEGQQVEYCSALGAKPLTVTIEKVYDTDEEKRVKFRYNGLVLSLPYHNPRRSYPYLSIQNFWDQNHPLNYENGELWNDLVPAQGEAETVEGELIRAVNRLFYEYCNNGNCNAGERQFVTECYSCSNCSGTGEVEDPYFDPEENDADEQDSVVDCEECGGSGETEEEEEGDVHITEMYDGFLSFIEQHIPTLSPEVDAVRELICNDALHYNYTYSNAEMAIYQRLSEEVTLWVLNSMTTIEFDVEPSNEQK